MFQVCYRPWGRQSWFQGAVQACPDDSDDDSDDDVDDSDDDPDDSDEDPDDDPDDSDDDPDDSDDDPDGSDDDHHLYISQTPFTPQRRGPK